MSKDNNRKLIEIDRKINLAKRDLEELYKLRESIRSIEAEEVATKGLLKKLRAQRRYKLKEASLFTA